MKVYLTSWGYYSCCDSDYEIEAIYSTYELALHYVQKQVEIKNLQEEKSKKTGKSLNRWSDGDYWISILTGYMDSPVLFMSKEEYEKMEKE